MNKIEKVSEVADKVAELKDIIGPDDSIIFLVGMPYDDALCTKVHGMRAGIVSTLFAWAQNNEMAAEDIVQCAKMIQDFKKKSSGLDQVPNKATKPVC